MRRSKEIIVLLGLLLGAVAFVLWYVVDRRREQRAAPTNAGSDHRAGPLAPERPFVELGGKHDGKTIDFSSGQPQVKDSPADRAALEAGLKEIAEATQDLTFPAEPKPPRRP